MGRGKRRSQGVALSDTRQRRVPADLTTRLIGAAHDAPVAGERVQLVRTKGASGGVKRGERGTVTGQSGSLLSVSWDEGRETELKLRDDHYTVITEAERQERHEHLHKHRIAAQSRVAVRRLRSPRAKAALKRDWRGQVVGLDADGLLDVSFDKGPRLIIDPLLDALDNVSGEEQARARELALKSLGAGLGMRLELLGDIPGEARLTAGLRGTVVDFNGNKLGIDWDNGLTAADLLPESDLPYIKVIAPPGTVDVAAKRQQD